MRKCQQSDCEVEIPENSKKTYCSRSCSAKVSNQGRRRHGQAPKVCPNCQGSVRAREGITYCSRSCRQNHDEVLWLAGELSGTWKYDTANYVRRWLERTQGLVCLLCDIVSLRPEVATVLQLDHIDGNWENNRPENVRLLCPTCHALTKNYGSKNMGSGRTWKSSYKQFAPKADV